MIPPVRTWLWLNGETTSTFCLILSFFIIQRRLSTKELMPSNCGAGEDSSESLGLSRREIEPVNPKGNQHWIFIGRTDAEVEAPTLWPRDAKSWLIRKDSDDGKDWRQEEMGTTEDEIVGWHHQHNGPEFGWIPRVGDWQEGLECCNSWDRKELDTTERLIWSDLIWEIIL